MSDDTLSPASHRVWISRVLVRVIPEEARPSSPPSQNSHYGVIPTKFILVADVNLVPPGEDTSRTHFRLASSHRHEQDVDPRDTAQASLVGELGLVPDPNRLWREECWVREGDDGVYWDYFFCTDIYESEQKEFRPRNASKATVPVLLDHTQFRMMMQLHRFHEERIAKASRHWPQLIAA